MKLTPKQSEALRIVAEGKFYPVLVKEEDGWYARWRASERKEEFDVDGWVDSYVREANLTRLTEDAEDQKHETLHDAWMMALKSRTGLVNWDEEECARFAAELEEWSGGAENDVAARKALVFRFTAAEDAFTVRLDAVSSRRKLRALGQATFVTGVLRQLKRCGEELVVELTRSEAEMFVKEDAAALTDAGYTVEGLPEKAKVYASAKIGDERETGVADFKNVPMKLVVHVAGEEVSAEEIRFLLDQGSPLVFFRDRWIEVDRNILKAALKALEKGVGSKPNILSFAMGIGHVGMLEIESLSAHGWLRGLIHELRSRIASDAPLMAAEEEHSGTIKLRPYQSRGVRWMRFLTEHGFGALLADEMGLGKTIQTIAWISGLKRGEDEGPVLVVAPLTLLANWRRELEKFAPQLKTYVHQGESRLLATGLRIEAAKTDVILTSYNLLVKDYSCLRGIAWAALVLDEAQAIKNPDTQVARAVKSLLPPRRIALTGTPIENSIRDVWALEDFLNPGFLGDRKTFRDRFVKPLAYDLHAVAAKRLTHALEPFVLRRLKSDPGVAAEIGEKREIREYCRLAQEERKAYEAALSTYRVSERTQGDMFALLTELKQICDGSLREDEELVRSDCGKLAHLMELLESIFEAGESALVFTQYAKVGARLKKALSERFARRIPFLHGGLSVKAREEEIRRFNHAGATAFVLSLKAGGFGLNLTKATHVIHYDRWWNPAVENQATDRAHRIGQTKDVFVHLMITEGTIEERVDEMLRKKSTLKDLLSDGQAFWEAAQLV